MRRRDLFRSGAIATGARRRRGRRLVRAFAAAFLAALLALGVKAWQNRRDVVALGPFEAAVAAVVPGAPVAFRIADPYAVEGTWFKAQLHTHTVHSLDGGWPVEASLRAYRERGYDFVALTDHDVITRPAGVPEGMVVVPAVENTVTFPFWPLGQHAVFLFVERQVTRGGARERFRAAAEQGGIVSIAHPSWVGNVGTGRWEMRHLMAAGEFTLMEVYNPHSDSRRDTALWHEVVVRRGPGEPVWAVAVDDAHDERLFDRGWTMVKAAAQTPAALAEALRRGSLYASTGPRVRFGASGGAIVVGGEEPGIYEVSFISSTMDVVKAYRGELPAAYTPTGTEGFVRVEVREAGTGASAWSQPFWLIPVETEVRP